MSHETLKKAAEKDPKAFSQLAEDMDSGRISVDAAYQLVRESQKEPGVRLSPEELKEAKKIKRSRRSPASAS